MTRVRNEGNTDRACFVIGDVDFSLHAAQARRWGGCVMVAAAFAVAGCGSQPQGTVKDAAQASEPVVLRDSARTTPGEDKDGNSQTGPVDDDVATSTREPTPGAGRRNEVVIRPRTVLTGQGVIRQFDDDPPVICFGPVAEVYPPECTGPLILGLDWQEMPEFRQAQDVRWGHAQVVGTYDGQAFTLNQPPLEATFPAEPDGGIGLDPYAALCPDPFTDGGKELEELSTEAEQARSKTVRVLEDNPAYVSSFLAEGMTVLNVIMVPGTDLAELRAELREMWPGGLCLQNRPEPPREAVYRAMDALGRANLPELFSWSAAPEGGLDVEVLVANIDTVKAVYEAVSTYLDPDGVHINGALVPRQR